MPRAATHAQRAPQDCVDVRSDQLQGLVAPRRNSATKTVRWCPSSSTIPPFADVDRNTLVEIRKERRHPRATFNAYPSPAEVSSSFSSQIQDDANAGQRGMSFALSSPRFPTGAAPWTMPSIPAMTSNNTTTVAATDSRTDDPNRDARAILPLPKRTPVGLSHSSHSYPFLPESSSSWHSQSKVSETKTLSADVPCTMSIGYTRALESAVTPNVSSVSVYIPHNHSQSAGVESSVSPSHCQHVQHQQSLTVTPLPRMSNFPLPHHTCSHTNSQSNVDTKANMCTLLCEVCTGQDAASSTSIRNDAAERTLVLNGFVVTEQPNKASQGLGSLLQTHPQNLSESSARKLPLPRRSYIRTLRSQTQAQRRGPEGRYLANSQGA